MNWFTKLFHKHNVIWTNRKVIGKTSIDFTSSGVIDIQPATEYLYEGYCLNDEKDRK